jgi:transposase
MDALSAVVPVAGKRRKRSALERLRIVEETLAPGASVARVARSHGINANQVFAWRKLHLAGKLGDHGEPAVSSSQRLLPVTVTEAKRPSEIAVSTARNAASAACISQLGTASIQIQLPKAMVRVEASRILQRSASSWSVCADDHVPDEHAHLACSRCDRHATRLHRWCRPRLKLSRSPVTSSSSADVAGIRHNASSFRSLAV